MSAKKPISEATIRIRETSPGEVTVEMTQPLVQGGHVDGAMKLAISMVTNQRHALARSDAPKIKKTLLVYHVAGRRVARELGV